MKINSNDQYLALIVKALDDIIAPELSTSGAQSTLDIVKQTLVELRRRESGGADLLCRHILAGYQYLEHFHQLLGSTCPSVPEVNEKLAFQELIATHAELTGLLNRAGQALVDGAIPGREALLHDVASWECAYYTGMAGLDVEPLPPPPSSGSPLDRERLQRFITTVEPWCEQPIVLDEFRALPGGFGKQTFLCAFKQADGCTRELVVRKLDPMPIMAHGACNLDNEYALLCALPEDYPAPKPLAYARNFEDVDADFYIVDRSPGDVPGAFLQGMNTEVPEAVFLDLAAYLGRLHSLPLSRFGAYAREFEAPGILNGNVSQAYEKNLQGWLDYIDREAHLDSPFMVWLLAWMADHIPTDERPPVVVHGDFNIHNVLVHEGRISTVLDWECAGIGAPEQDLAYIKPHISQHIDWSHFMACYLEHGGREPRPEMMAYGMVYASLRTNLAGNRATLNLQDGRNQDMRYAMVELGFTPSFMRLALDNAAINL